MGLDADDLLLFARVIDHGSLSRAAERLRLPKSTVSRRLAALEARLGEKLLQRTTRRLTLTDFGQGVLEHARAVGAEVDSALALALHRQQRPKGRLRVSMPADFAHQTLGGMLQRYVRDHPEVQLELDLSPRRVDLVAEGFDVAVRMGDLPDDSQLSARRLATHSFALFAAPSHLQQHGEPQQPDDLLRLHGLMLLGRGGDPMPWQLVRAGSSGAQAWQGVPARRTLVNAPDMLRNMALAGLGVVAISLVSAQSHVEAGTLVRLLPDWHPPQPLTCWAVFPERRLMPLRTRLFIDAMAAELA